MGKQMNAGDKVIDRNWCFSFFVNYFLWIRIAINDLYTLWSMQWQDGCGRMACKSLWFKVFDRQHFGGPFVHTVAPNHAIRFVCILFCIFASLPAKWGRIDRVRLACKLLADNNQLYDTELDVYILITAGAIVCTRPKSTFALNFIIEWWWRRRRLRRYIAGRQRSLQCWVRNFAVCTLSLLSIFIWCCNNDGHGIVYAPHSWRRRWIPWSDQHFSEALDIRGAIKSESTKHSANTREYNNV